MRRRSVTSAPSVERGEWRVEPDRPVPMGRWHYLTYGLHVGPFWLEAMRKWNASALPKETR